MKINIEFVLDGQPWAGLDEWKTYVTTNAATASEVLSRAAFIEKIRNGPAFDFTTDSPAIVADKIAAAGSLVVKVAFYGKSSKAIGFEDRRSHVVHFNTRKRREGAGSPGNIAHETMHVLGFEHNGNRRRGNENTVPYRVGDWVDQALRIRATSIDGDLDDSDEGK